MENKITEERKREIIDKIRACFRRADTSRGSSQAEAETSIKMAKRLMMSYNLSQAEVEMGEGTADSSENAQNVVEEGDLGHYKNMEKYEIYISIVCQHLFDVRPILDNYWDKESGKTRKCIVFIGLETDVAIAKEAYKIIRDDVHNLDSQLGRKVSIEDRYQYRHGVVQSLIEKAKEQVADATKEQMEKCTALMVVKDKAVQNYMDQKHPNLRSSRMRGTRYSEAYMAGRQDGRKMNLSFSRRLK